MIAETRLPKRLTVNHESVFLTTKGLCFFSPEILEEWSMNVGRKQYNDVPLSIEWYSDVREWRQLNRQLS